MSGVLLAVDPGDVRTGVAASDPGQLLASPVATLPASEAVTEVVTLASERAAVGILVGLPLTLAGGEGMATAKARKYAQRLVAALAHGEWGAAGEPPPVFLVDERLTTVSAASALRSAGHDSRSARRVVDQAAATALLQGVLDAVTARAVSWHEVVASLGERVRVSSAG